jgi:hypothetical protein
MFLDLTCVESVASNSVITFTSKNEKIDQSELLKLSCFLFVIIYVLPILSSF